MPVSLFPRSFCLLDCNISDQNLASGINTHGGQGTLKPGAQPLNQVIVYSGDKEPDQLPGERLSKKPIKIVPKHGGEALFASSRLNLAKIYTVEHNFPVGAIGDVDKNDLPRLEQYFRDIHKGLFEDEEEVVAI